MELDSDKMEVRLPQEKLQQLKQGRKAGKKRKVLFLVGLLSHTSKSVRPGRAYVRRLIDPSTIAKHINHYVWINAEVRADMEWWQYFLSLWNGITLMYTSAQ